MIQEVETIGFNEFEANEDINCLDKRISNINKDQGPCVSLLIERLRKYGYNVPSGNKFTQQVADAALGFKLSHGRPYPNPIIAKDEWKMLMEEPSIKPLVIKDSKLVMNCFKKKLSLGSTGPCVRLAKERLKIHGYNVSDDDIFDNNMAEQVINFRADQNWKAEPIIASKEWTMLFTDPSRLQVTKINKTKNESLPSKPFNTSTIPQARETDVGPIIDIKPTTSKKSSILPYIFIGGGLLIGGVLIYFKMKKKEEE